MKEAIYKGHGIRAVSYESPGHGWIPSAQILSSTGDTETSTPVTWHPKTRVLFQDEADGIAIQNAKTWIDKYTFSDPPPPCKNCGQPQSFLEREELNARGLVTARAPQYLCINPMCESNQPDEPSPPQRKRKKRRPSRG